MRTFVLSLACAVSVFITQDFLGRSVDLPNDYINTDNPIEKGSDEVTNSIGMEFVLTKPGSFVMGSPLDEPGRGDDEGPQHRVTISQAFYIGKFEVTQGQWLAVMGTNPSKFKAGDDYPVELVSWNDVVEFCRKLSDREGVTYRLPTEAEWEYACRAGSTTEYYWGDDIDSRYCWYKDNSGNRSHQVGGKLPNARGLHDMLGNVWEWCSDWYGEDYYKNSPVENPGGPSSGRYRVLRGGCWSYGADALRSAHRYGYAPINGGSYIGFRCVREVGN